MMLPQPNEAFVWVQAAAGPVLVCRPLEPLAPHVFTTRHWPLGSSTPEDDGDAGWRDVASALGIDTRKLVRVHQVHGADVAIAHEDSDIRQDGDIIVSKDPALALAIRAADCVPLLIADRRTGAIAAAHAGWRGMAARVPAVTVAALTGEYGSRVEDLVAAAGPSIGACCYEVGFDVRERFARAGFNEQELERWFLNAPRPTADNPSMRGIGDRPREGHWFFDGWAATRDQLIAAGLLSAQIFAAETCTASHPEAFCSYRRDGRPAGRMAAAIRRPRPGPSPRSPDDPHAHSIRGGRART